MKKLLLFAFASVIAIDVFAQSTAGRSVSERLFIEAAATSSLKQHGYNILSADVKTGYRLTPRFYGYATAGADMGLCKKDNLRTYINGNAIGAGLGYTLFKDKDNRNWDIRGSWAHSIGGANWKQSVYDASVLYTMKNSSAPVWSIGFKHIHSHTVGIPNFNVVYGSIGFRF